MAADTRDSLATLRTYLMRLVLLLMVVVGGWAVWQNPPAWLVAAIKHATEKPPAWPNDYARGVAQAKAEHKPILLSFTGSDWCSVCQEFDQYVLDTPAFRDYAAKNLVFVEIDMPEHKSQPAALKDQNMRLVMKYDVHGFPTVILLNSEEKMLGKIEGYGEYGPKSFITDLENFAKNNRSNQIPAL
jgi:protein disulfide-isomerase